MQYFEPNRARRVDVDKTLAALLLALIQILLIGLFLSVGWYILME